MKNYLVPILLALIIFALSAKYTTAVEPQKNRLLCTPRPSKEAAALYRYLQEMNGRRILSGQMNSSWGIDEFEYIKAKTGKLPAVKGLDFIHQRENENEVLQAIEWWKKGGIPTIIWHWCAPGTGEGYDNCKKAILIDNCFIEGTPEYKAFRAELKAKADLLQKTKEANVPILWRPFHEPNGTWFWWGKQGPEAFKKLWIAMHEYFVKERRLNNLIWVLGYNEEPDEAWYPGDKYVDIIGADSYGDVNEPRKKMHTSLKRIANNNTMPVSFHVCGIPPDPAKCKAQGVMWSWWMEWHTNWLTKVDIAYLKKVYNHELVLTLDEIPNIMVMSKNWRK